MFKRLKGFTLIELLIVVAIIAILAAIAVPNFLEAQTRSKVARVKADQRSLATAIEMYYVDNNVYPACATSFADLRAFGANELTNAPDSPGPNCRWNPTFRRRTADDVDNQVMSLTTPQQYITSWFADPFAATKGATYRYAPRYNGWIVLSYGPDFDETKDLSIPGGLQGQGGVTASVMCSGDVPVEDGYGGYEETYYSPAGRNPSDEMLDLIYDPTNGSSSEGDVVRFKE